MWKRNPLVHFAIAFSLAILFTVGLLFFIVVKTEFWEDGRTPPVVIDGVVESRSNMQLRNGLTRVNIQKANIIYTVEVSQKFYSQLTQGKPVQLVVAPGLSHVYEIKILPNGPAITESGYKTGVLFQDFQVPVVVIISLVGLLILGLFVYAFLSLADWFLPARQEQGIIVARIEQGEFSNSGYTLLMRRWNGGKNERSLRFYVGETLFKSLENIEFIAVTYTPFFHFVRHLVPMEYTSLTPAEIKIAQNTPPEKMRLLYTTNWRKRILMLSDGIIALGMFVAVVCTSANAIPSWLSLEKQASIQERYFLPALAFVSLLLGFYFSSTFIQKLHDLRAPKKITVGPVLSKWRVNSGTNDTRRQIVVVDGGLQAGSEGVKKFDISNFLFEELKVGDIVEIEHTPRLRYIFRLEVKGYQELSQKFSQ
jgi:hypothetical protein